MAEEQAANNFNKTRQGKGLFDWLGVDRDVDPYVAKTDQGCLNGDLAECFKSQALRYFSDFFDQPRYDMNERVKVVRMSSNVVRQVDRQPYEYSGEARYEPRISKKYITSFSINYIYTLISHDFSFQVHRLRMGSTDEVRPKKNRKVRENGGHRIARNFGRNWRKRSVRATIPGRNRRRNRYS